MFLYTGLFGAPSRVKDITKVVGLSDMQVIGYGLVVGLDGSGDRSIRTALIASQSAANMLERFGLTIDPRDLRLRNVAAVMVTGMVPPFIESGEKIDVTVSSIGDARSLQGGTLLLTPLTSPDGEIYAHAQGQLAVGGFMAESGIGDRISRNHTQVGVVTSGATMVRSRRVNYVENNSISLALNTPDFATSLNISEAINQHFNQNLSQPVDRSTVAINVPTQAPLDNPVSFLAELEQIEVEVDVPARVVINERTGTIVVGTDVRISAAAISHGNLTVQIQQTPIISQPPAFSQQGQTAVVPDAQMQVQEDINSVEVLQESVTVGEVANALNALGVRPRDL
ncbi:MAG TPA: flagellar basal body P-ring protein FlgI, partial [bacterium]|nr:flagellar basal body P-ring protein FlgI [bacterium]